MNVNIKVSLTDDQRNLIKRKLTGKAVKSMVTRKEVNYMVNGFMQALLEDLEQDHRIADSGQAQRNEVPLQQFDQSKVPAEHRHMPLSWQMGWYRGRYVIKSFTR